MLVVGAVQRLVLVGIGDHVDRGLLGAGCTAGVTDTFAHDVGVAGGAASAEEAAVHVIPDPDQDEPLYRADDEHE